VVVITAGDLADGGWHAVLGMMDDYMLGGYGN